MTKRTRVVMSVGVLVCVVVMLIAFVLAFQPTPERALFNQIQIGEPLHVAEGFLGKAEKVLGIDNRGQVGSNGYIWRPNDRITIWVEVDADKRITKKSFQDERDGWLTKLCRRLGL